MMSGQDKRFQPLGTHLIHVDGDTVFLIARGSVTIDDMQYLLDLTASVKRQHGCLFMVYDARKGTGIDADARQMVATRATTNEEADLEVAFGISFALRILLSMVVRAQKVLQNRSVNLHLFDTENEALTFLEKGRARIRQEKAANHHFAASLQQRTPVE
jgi:hypothetical protein